MQNEEMNYQQPEEIKTEQKEFSLQITTEIAGQLRSASGWAKFLSILGFVFVGFIIFAGVLVSLIMSFVPQENDIFPFPAFLFGIIYLVFGAIYILPVLYLFRFSAGIQKALFTKNQEQMSKAFSNLKAHYRYIGIMMLAIFALYLIIIVIMIFVGIFTGFSGFMGMQA